MAAWLVCALLGLACGRVVRSQREGRPGPRCALRRSIGMGGPASPLTWNIGYDPIVAGLAAAVRIPDPTYVDDLAAFVVGPAQAVRALIFLVFASWAAGLHIAMHDCCYVQFERWSEALEVAVKLRPLRLTPQRRVYGLSPRLARAMLRIAAPDLA